MTRWKVYRDNGRGRWVAAMDGRTDREFGLSTWRQAYYFGLANAR